MNLEPAPHETLDRIAGNWHVFQLRDGHRFSTDDQVVAWHAVRERPDARRVLDLGCGICSVGLSVLHRLADPAATLTGIEAQDVSFALAQRSVRLNGLDDRVTLLHGDIRDASLLDGQFDLITGSPPYIPLGKGVVSPHPQRAACRMELRGSVIDYFEAARRWLAPGGGVCVVMAAGDPRFEEGARAARFTVRSRIDYPFREGRPPTIATLFCMRDEDGPHPERREETVTVRDATGEFTETYLGIRAGVAPVP